MSVQVIPLDRTEIPPFSMSDRFRTEIAYFMSLPVDGNPTLPSGEYWVRKAEMEAWLADGVFRLISPLDSASQAEIELSEEQEAWLEWMLANQIERIRIA